MNTTDKIITALTPGSIFNRNGLIFRSVFSLAEFSGLEENEVLELLNGDLAQMVTCKPSKKGKGILVALTEQIPVEEPDGPVAIVVAPIAPGVPLQQEAEEVAAEGPLGDAPIDDAEEVVGENLPQ